MIIINFIDYICKPPRMLREIHIDKFNKIITQFKPQIFNNLTIIESKPYNQNVQFYISYDQRHNYYQLYNTTKELQPILGDIQFLEKSPKIILIKDDKDYIILQQKIEENLYEHLLSSESKSNPEPYLEESLAKKIIEDLKDSLGDYLKHSIDYNVINPRNIVRRGMDWQFSLVGLLFKNDRESLDYYKEYIKKQHRNVYALGTLLFKLLFGFVPFERLKQKKAFSFGDYIKHLDREQSKKSLKIYYYSYRLLEVSSKAKQLIELALNEKITLEQFYNNSFFAKDYFTGAKKQINPHTKQIKMLSLFSQAHQSLVMAAIEHHKKYPQERLNPRLMYAHEFLKDQIINHLKKHAVLCEVQFDQSFSNSRLKQAYKPPEEQYEQVHLDYFYGQEQFDRQLDYPCRDLLKMISNRHSQLGDNNFQNKQAEIKLYAYPYAVVFELLKVIKAQPGQIIRKIKILIQDLLQISQLHRTKLIQPLHKTELIIKSFDQIKIRFREQINDLYKYFLNEAIKKYNVKKDKLQYAQKSNLKSMGLEYYRLCLKLMECSLLVRKRGSGLDLSRIEVSTRKEIESDLNELLKQYFPNKIQIN